MAQPPKPPLNVYVQPGESIGDALVRCLIAIKEDEAGSIQIPAGVKIYGSDFTQTEFIERRTTVDP